MQSKLWKLYGNRGRLMGMLKSVTANTDLPSNNKILLSAEITRAIAATDKLIQTEKTNARPK